MIDIANEPVMMGWIVPAIMAASALFSGLGGHKKKKAEETLKKEEAQNLYNAQEGQFNNQEDSRLARLGVLKGLSQTGRNAGRGAFDLSGIDPAVFTNRHKFSGVLPAKNTGSSTIGSILSGLGSAGSAYAQSEYNQQAEDKQMEWICRINPALCPKGKPSGIEDPAVGLF